jgi:4-amino-4-deoxy-L-arabinose transferase-like glycosyltransferase
VQQVVRRGQSVAYPIAAVAVSLAGLFTSFFRLSTASVTPDEPGYVGAGWIYMHAHVGALPFTVPNNLEHPPLAKYLFGLAQVLAGHRSLLSARVVAATCTVLTGVVLAVFIGRAANRWAGLLAASLFVMLPQHGLFSDSIGRHAMLEPVAILFSVSALAASWWWFAGSGARAWAWALIAGVLTGCATSAKESAFLGMIGVVVLGVALTSRSWRALAERVAQSASALVVAGLVFLALYLPVGSPMKLVRHMIEFQSRESECGHPVNVAGNSYWFPPWWANFWFAGHTVGAAATALLLATCGVAVYGVMTDRVVQWLLASLVGPVIFFCFLTTIALPYYWTLWAPAYYSLAAIGTVKLCTLALRAEWRRPIALAAGVTVLLAFCATWVADAADLHLEGPAAVAKATHQGRDGSLLLIDYSLPALHQYMSARPFKVSVPTSPDTVRYIVVASHVRVGVVKAATLAFARVNVAQGTVHKIYSDSGVTVYERNGAFVQPTAQQIAAVTPPTAGQTPCKPIR